MTMRKRTCAWPWPCRDPLCGYGYCRRHMEVMQRAGMVPHDVMVDAADARERIAEHRVRGRRYDELIKLAKVHHCTIECIVAGRAKIKTSTHSKIMAVPLPPTTVGTMRRLHSLMRMGFSRRHIATETGYTCTALYQAMTRRRFTSAMRLAIAEAFDRLDHGPSKMAAIKAKKAGYPPMMAWEGIDIDDPRAKPDLGKKIRDHGFDEAQVIQIMSGRRDINYDSAPRRVKAARDEAIRRFGTRYSADWIAAQVNCTKRTVERIRAEQKQAA